MDNDCQTEVVRDLMRMSAQAEALFLGAIYNKPELLVGYSSCVKSEYDFSDEYMRFLYNNAEIMYKRGIVFEKSNYITYFNEDPELSRYFNSFGGYIFIDKLTKVSDVNCAAAYFNNLKKFSLLRELKNKGFDTNLILNLPEFQQFDAYDVYRIVRGLVDRTQSIIINDKSAQVINTGTRKMLNSFIEEPDFGIALPFPIMNEMFRGMMLDTTMGIGMLSNTGKSRLMEKIAAYITLVLRQRVVIIVNEMTLGALKKCLITTVLNNPEFQALHGVDIVKPEKELTDGVYHDSAGNIIYRKTDENGTVIETTEEFIKRLEETSEEYRKVMQVADWIDAETQELMYCVDVGDDFDDDRLEFEIRNAHFKNGVNYWFYDTFQADLHSNGDWASIKTTAMKLEHLSKELGMFGFMTFQLTDDTEYTKPDELTSNNIASCKHIKHGLWTMGMLKEIPPDDFFKYGYYQSDKDWGDDVICDLKEDRRYFIFNTEKNRFGDKKKIVIEVNLDLNTWIEKGVLAKKT